MLWDSRKPSQVLRFDVRKGPLALSALVLVTISPVMLWLAFYLVHHPAVQLHGRGGLLNLLPNPVRVAVFAALGSILLLTGILLAIRTMTSPGELTLQTSGIAFSSYRLTWAARWQDVQSIKVIRQTVLIQRSGQQQGNILNRLWMQMRYGCDPDSLRVSIAPVQKPDGGKIGPQELAALIEHFQGAANQPTRPDAA